MSLSRSRTLYLVLCLALAVFSVRPVGFVDRLLDVALIPTRLFAELAAPIGYLQGRDVHASGPERRHLAEVERRGHEVLEEIILASALPQAARLTEGARALHAEVVARKGDDDHIRIRVRSHRGLVPGLPVVSGDWFVGVVTEILGPPEAESRLDAQAGDLVVELITGAEARIGALVLPQPGPDGTPDARRAPLQLVAGGLAPRGDAVYLDVHNPSDRGGVLGHVVVDEPPGLSEVHTSLANGFKLGEIALEEVDQKPVLGIRPGLDYESGLYQVLVLVPEFLQLEPRGEAQSPLDDGRWARARFTLRGEPSSWREGRKLDMGRLHGIAERAALLSGTRLAGRVARAGVMTSDVQLVGDPGFGFAAVAVIEDEQGATPHVLGRLRGLGRAPNGLLRFAWQATLPLPLLPGGAEEQDKVRAFIWTGSGDEGVPRGLFVGETLLPRGPGPHEIRILQPVGAREPRSLAVRLAGRGGGAP